jgi:hypothetical protein
VYSNLQNSCHTAGSDRQWPSIVIILLLANQSCSKPPPISAETMTTVLQIAVELHCTSFVCEGNLPDPHFSLNIHSKIKTRGWIPETSFIPDHNLSHITPLLCYPNSNLLPSSVQIDTLLHGTQIGYAELNRAIC